MFTYYECSRKREQEELVNSVLRMPNNIHLSAVPQVPDVPDVPQDVPHVPKFVWHLPINIGRMCTGELFFNKVLTKIFVGMI
jgi:hypothetical protein